MKLFISICLFAVFILSSQPGFSQKEIEISGENFLLYSVKKGETTYSICEKYKVTQAELKKANPELTAILKAGSTIKIPVKKEVEVTKPESATVKSAVAPEPEFYYHKVGKKQTIFSIAKQYNISANELIRYNPEITNGIVLGQVLRVPVKTDDLAASTDQSKTVNNSEESTISPAQTGNKLRIHKVVADETLYSLAKKYDLTQEELITANPSLDKGLKTGMSLVIPSKKIQQTIDNEQSLTAFEKYKVQSGETLFSLASRFGVEVGDLKKVNPQLFSRSLEIGETILIPKHSTTTPPEETVRKSKEIESKEPVKEIESENCIPISGLNNKKYNVALLLPLHLQSNDSINPSRLNPENLLSKIDFSKTISSMPVVANDSVTTVIKGTNIDQRTQGFLEFYEGALLAVDSLQQTGMNIELYVFDVTNQAMVNTLLQLDVFRELNLIIGPVYPELQESVALFAAKNRIPMVSPLAPNGNFEANNPYYIKVNPSKEYQLEETADYIAKEFVDKNFFLLPMTGNSNSNEAKLAELGKEKLLEARQSLNNKKDLFHEYSFQKQGLNDLTSILDEKGENVFIIPSDNEAQVSVAVTNLNALAEKYNVVLIGTSSFTKMKSIQTENYHHIRLRYLSPTFVDYAKPLARRFVSRYREIFSGEPSQFSHQGFDVAYYFMSALYRYGKDFKNCLPNYPMELTQMDFNFRRMSPVGGYMNCGLFVTAYERNYDILNYGVVGGGEPSTKNK